MYKNHQPTKTYDIHPVSITLIQKGHPWVTNDKFSERFQPNDRFIIASNRGRPMALLLHDPTHKQVRARVWSTSGDYPKQMKTFKDDLVARMRAAISKRVTADYTKDRSHYYLIFGEGDLLPGVFVQYLNGEILVQFYMEFWTPLKEYLIQMLVEIINSEMKLNIKLENVWFQQRTNTKEKAISSDPNITSKDIEIEEFGVKYKVSLGKYYDHGIYTDMASIRNKIRTPLTKSRSVLNLFSYTGAFSLFALKLGVESVCSVDLSEKYIRWLNENIDLNEDLDGNKHESMTKSTQVALKKFKTEERKFDFIITDPPSSSSDGKKRTNALNDYKEFLPQIYNLLEKGGHTLIFINTHKVTMKKFEDRMKQIMENKSLNFSIIGKYNLSEDCPNKKGFPEGSYLKGMLLKRND
jgi:23S rRNA (cytosine1962-C5)-methyltransferase